MEKVTGITYGTYEVHTIERSAPTVDPVAFQRVVRLIDEQISRAFWLPPHLLGIPTTTYEPQPLTLEQVQQLRETWSTVFERQHDLRLPQQSVRDYCRGCYYSNKGARFCGLGLTMEVGCTEREIYEQEGP